jgi:hypothetical protein
MRKIRIPVLRLNSKANCNKSRCNFRNIRPAAVFVGPVLSKNQSSPKEGWQSIWDNDLPASCVSVISLHFVRDADQVSPRLQDCEARSGRAYKAADDPVYPAFNRFALKLNFLRKLARGRYGCPVKPPPADLFSAAAQADL